MAFPPYTEIDLSQSLRSYWLDRVRQHTSDVYAGVPLSKFPEDLRVYEHLLWADRPDTVIEVGTQLGGSALWFRDRLRTLQAHGHIRDLRVVTIDVSQTAARHALSQVDPSYADTIHTVEGDIRSEGIVDTVAPLVGQRCLVVEDSAHAYDTTRASLEHLSPFVQPGGYLVVEDGCVDIDEMRLADDWPRGVLPALSDWLKTARGSDFRVRRDLQIYGITCHPGGFLQRRDHQA
jgi:cephalosporin hydroxylase